MSAHISKRGREAFEYFSQCADSLRLESIVFDAAGRPALECFHAHETHGQMLPCCEPELLARALNGKERHGMTVTMCAEDFIDRILFSAEIKENYPAPVAKEIFARARQMAVDRIGFVPTFVRNAMDFSEAS